MRLAWAWGLILLATACWAAVPETLPLRRLGVEDGLPSSSLNALAQDREGYLWIASKDGLARYDGLGFRIYRYAPGDEAALPGNNIQALHVDALDRVWVGVEGLGLSRLDSDRRRFRTFRMANTPAMGSDDVWTIASTPDGALWFGTFGGGLHRMDERERVLRYQPRAGDERSLPNENVIALATDAHGRLWVGTAHGLARWTGKDFQRVALEALSGPIIFSLSADADGSLWVGTDGGLDHLLADGRVEHPAWREQLSESGVTSVLRDRDGDRWLATRHGLSRERNGSVDRFESGLALIAAFEDHEGGLWFASADHGLLRLPAGWRHFTVLRNRADDAASLANAHVTATAMGRDGRLWVVGGSGGLDRLDPLSGQVERVGLSGDGFPDRRLWSVLERRDGSVWIGQQKGLSRFDPGAGTLRNWNGSDGHDATLLGPIDQLLETPDGLLWSSALGGGVQARDAAGQVVFQAKPGDGRGLDVADTEQLGIGPDGALWLAGGQGLRRWSDDRLRFETVAGGPGERVFGFVFLPPDTLWLTRMGALEAYRWEGRALKLFRRVDGDDGLPAAEAGGVLADRSGSLWLTTVRGLVRYDPVGERLRLYGVRDGLPSQEFDTLPPLMTAAGIGVASTAEGLVLFDPARMRGDAVSPRLAIEDIGLRRGEDTLSLPPSSTRLALGPDDRDLKINARLLSFADPLAHRYRFKLSGYDPDWVEVGTQGERVFSRLEPGRYRLEVIAANADGVWSAPRALDLTVSPAWWRTPWAKTLGGLLAIASLLLAAWGYRQQLRRRHAERLREQRRHLAEQNSLAKSRFLATLGHEIRTPMTGVLGMAELLQGTSLDAKQRGQVEAIQRAGQHLLRLVNDALDLARIEAGKLTLDDAPFDLHLLLDEVAALLRPLAEAKGLQFSLQRAPGTPRGLRGDGHRVRQILLNLGNNAIKFTDHGEVAVRSSAMTPQGVRLEVSDTGPGMNAEQTARLFQRFEQGEGARTTARYGGSGLGLAICAELAAAMSGRIDVESTPGLGSTFRVHLPLPAAELQATPTSAAKPATAATRLILLVEDDVTVAEVITGLLRALGHAVVHAPQALAALTELPQARFDLAFLDLDLPGLDGFELARLIRAQGHPLPLIALTARADADAEPQARAAGMDGFLRKPVTGQMLAEAMRSAGKGAA